MSNDDDYTVPVPARANSIQSVLLMSLHTARRLLITQIEAAKREGTSTASLERELGDNRKATRHLIGDQPQLHE